MIARRFLAKDLLDLQAEAEMLDGGKQERGDARRVLREVLEL